MTLQERSDLNHWDLKFGRREGRFIAMIGMSLGLAERHFQAQPEKDILGCIV